MVNSKDQTKKDKTVKLVPNFQVEQDIKLAEAQEEAKISDSNLEVVEEACPHFSILKERYAQYKGPDDYGNPDKIPTPISRRHEITPFIGIIARADLSKGLTIQPTRLIKHWVYDEETQTKKPFLTVNQIVTGVKPDGKDTGICTVRVGYYEYPLQFQQDGDGEWKPVNNKYKKVYYLPFTKEAVDKYAKKGDYHIKKYVVENMDGTKSANLTYDEFVNMPDEEQVKKAEGK